MTVQHKVLDNGHNDSKPGKQYDQPVIHGKVEADWDNYKFGRYERSYFLKCMSSLQLEAAIMERLFRIFS